VSALIEITREDIIRVLDKAKEGSFVPMPL
jgi:hypothetical protein